MAGTHLTAERILAAHRASSYRAWCSTRCVGTRVAGATAGLPDSDGHYWAGSYAT